MLAKGAAVVLKHVARAVAARMGEAQASMLQELSVTVRSGAARRRRQELQWGKPPCRGEG